MSSLLKEAIVDAKALKEAALKNAEASIIEKYSLEVKETLDKLLEQEALEPALGPEAEMDPALDPMADPMVDPMADPMTDPAAAEGQEAEEVVSDEDVPLAASDGIPDRDASKEGEPVEFDLNLNALQEAIGQLQSLQETMDEDQEIEISENDLYEILSDDDDDPYVEEDDGPSGLPEEPLQDPIEELAERLGVPTSELAAAAEAAGLEIYPEGA